MERVESRRNAGLDHFWFLFFKPVSVHWLGGGATPTNEADQPSPTQQCAEILLSPFSTHRPACKKLAEKERLRDWEQKEVSASRLLITIKQGPETAKCAFAAVQAVPAPGQGGFHDRAE